MTWPVLAPTASYEIVGRRSRFLKLFGLRVDLDQLEHELRSDGIEALCTGDDTGLIVAVTKATPDAGCSSARRRVYPQQRCAPSSSTICRDTPTANPTTPRCCGTARPPAEVPANGDGVRAIYRDVLNVDDVGDADTFVGLGGDSLSFVDTTQRLEREFGALPTNWHLRSVAELEAARRAGGAMGLSGGWRRAPFCGPWRS